MRPEILVRWCGLSCIVSGLLYVIAGIASFPFDGSQSWVEKAQSTEWLVFLLASSFHHFFLLFGLIGIFVYQLKSAGSLALAGFILASVGNLSYTGIGLAFAVLLPTMAASQDTHSVLSCFPLMQGDPSLPPCGAEVFVGILPWAAFSILSLSIGTMLVGASIMRSKVLPRPAAWLLIVGWVGYLVDDFVPLPIDWLMLLVVGVGLAWLGLRIWTPGNPSAALE